MAVTIDSTQIDYGTTAEAGDVRFSEPFAGTTGFTIAGAAGWIAIRPSLISRPTPIQLRGGGVE